MWWSQEGAGQRCEGIEEEGIEATMMLSLSQACGTSESRQVLV